MLRNTYSPLSKFNSWAFIRISLTESAEAHNTTTEIIKIYVKYGSSWRIQHGWNKIMYVKYGSSWRIQHGWNKRMYVKYGSSWRIQHGWNE